MVPYEDFPSPKTQTARSHRRLRQPRRRPMKTMAMPRTAATAPPISIHIERSVGEPVKARDTSDVNECDSLKPNTSRSKPAAISAIPIAVFIVGLNLLSHVT